MLKSETICAIDYLFGLKLLIDELMLKPGTTALLTTYSALIYWLMNWCWNQALTALSTTYSVLMIDWLIYVKTSNYLRYRLIFGLNLFIDWLMLKTGTIWAIDYVFGLDWLIDELMSKPGPICAIDYIHILPWFIDLLIDVETRNYLCYRLCIRSPEKRQNCIRFLTLQSRSEFKDYTR